MKSTLVKFAIMIAVMVGVYAVGSSVAAQITGGYGDLPADDKEVVRAVAFAVKAESSKSHTKVTLTRIEKAEVQVVAGLNYRVCMTVAIGRRKPASTKVTAVVYKNLKNKMSLSRWERGECKDL
jgi:hypothetical protein